MRCMRVGPVCPISSIPPCLPDLQPAGWMPPKHKWLPGQAREPCKNQFFSNILVRALRKQGHQDHQIRKREQPLIGGDAGRFRRPRDEAQVSALRKIVNVLDAKTRQACDLLIVEDFLSLLHVTHGPAPPLRPVFLYTTL